MLQYAKTLRPKTPVKSGLMLGLGRDDRGSAAGDAGFATARRGYSDAGAIFAAVAKHLPIIRYVPQSEFDELSDAGLRMGFAHVEAGPLVRSSYHADSSGAGGAS
jgi:lipoic acid synthetase